MPIASTLSMVRPALAAGYGVAAFNVLDELSIRAVVDAAEQARSPVIVQTSVKTVRSIGADLLGQMFRSRAARATVDVALHLDHCPDPAVIDQCLAAGWSSVLFDASSLPLEEAYDQTRQVVARARDCGAAVESEIENIRGVEDGIGSEDEGRRYPIDVVASFVRGTDVDLFAPAIGTAHGAYRERPRLNPERVTQLCAATGRPMVLHGGTGLTADQFSDLVSRGCAKVNISTAIKHTYLRSSLAFLRECERLSNWDPPALFDAVASAVQAAVTDHVTMVGSAGKSG